MLDWPFSRPIPDCFSPPYGTMGSSPWVASLTWTMPVWICRAIRVPREMSRVDGAGQSEVGVVGDVDRLLVVAEFHQQDDGPEQFVVGNGGLSIDVLQDHRRHDVADRFAAHQCFRAGRHRVVDLLLKRRDLARIDQRPDHGGRLRGIPGSQGGGLAAEAVPEVRRNTRMHQDAVGRHADLAGRWCVRCCRGAQRPRAPVGVRSSDSWGSLRDKTFRSIWRR
jgi:hypothetical protein